MSRLVKVGRAIAGVTLGVVIVAALVTGMLPGSVSRAESCPKGSLQTFYSGAHKCLSVAQRARIHREFVKLRKQGVSRRRAVRIVANRFRVSRAVVRRIEKESASSAPAAPGGSALPGRLDEPSNRSEFEPARNLIASASCTTTWPRGAVAALHWTPAPERGDEQRVVVTIYRDGFESGRFDSSESLSPGRSAFEWNRIHGQAIHLWRVVTLHGDQWSSSETASFAGPTCTVDHVPTG